MKAVICTKYGSPEVLKVKNIDKPTPKNNEILIKVYASAVTTADSMMRRADPFIARFFLGFTKPKNPITGTGVSGEVVEIGKDVTLFKVGDLVFGETGLNFGANAEYVSVLENGVLAIKPDNISHEEACSVCDGLLTSINFLKNLANIKKGDKILINGASGSVGSAAILLAKQFGAEVTGVCSTKNIEMLKSLGADYVIDYKKENFINNNKQYDIIFDAIGKSSFSESKKSLTEAGIYMSAVLKISLLFKMLFTAKSKKKKAKFSATGALKHKELNLLLKEVKTYMENTNIKPFIDKTYKIEEIVEAHEYVDSGHKKGSVVISF